MFHHRIITLAAIVIAVTTIAGCGDDRPVYQIDPDNHDSGAGGASSDAATNNDGGEAGEGGSSGDTGSGGTAGDTGGSGGSDAGTVILPGSFMTGKQLFSFSITEADAYSSYGFYATKNGQLKNCAADKDCMQKAKDDTAGRPFQWLVTEKNYDESLGVLAKAFCVYEKAVSPSGRFELDAGTGCKNKGSSTYRDCLVSGVATMFYSDGSVKASIELGPSKHIMVGYESGDVAQPFVFCHISEHRELLRLGTLPGFDIAAGSYSGSSGSSLLALNGSQAIEMASAFVGMATHLRPTIEVSNQSISSAAEIDLSRLVIPGKQIVTSATF